jgi:cytochrome c553
MHRKAASSHVHRARESRTSPQRRYRRTGGHRLRWCAAGLGLAVLALGTVGCGSNWADLLTSTGDAAATTVLDILLTDFTNAVADSVHGTSQQEVGDGQDGGGGDQGGDGGGGSGDSGQVTGDQAAGEQLYTSSNCAACHCADGSGGCALDSPALQGTDAAALDNFLRGDAPHPGGKLDTDAQGIADLAAYLASL